MPENDCGNDDNDPGQLPRQYREYEGMDNQHEKIIGYRNLTQDEIDSMNLCKSVAVTVGDLCNTIEQLQGIDKRWLAIAKTDLQKGFMALIRSIAKPETF